MLQDLCCACSESLISELLKHKGDLAFPYMGRKNKRGLLWGQHRTLYAELSSLILCHGHSPVCSSALGGIELEGCRKVMSGEKEELDLTSHLTSHRVAMVRPGLRSCEGSRCCPGSLTLLRYPLGLISGHTSSLSPGRWVLHPALKPFRKWGVCGSWQKAVPGGQWRKAISSHDKTLEKTITCTRAALFSAAFYRGQPTVSYRLSFHSALHREVFQPSRGMLKASPPQTIPGPWERALRGDKCSCGLAAVTGTEGDFL